MANFVCSVGTHDLNIEKGKWKEEVLMLPIQMDLIDLIGKFLWEEPFLVFVVIEILRRATNSQNYSLNSVFDLGNGLDDLCRRSNVTGRVEATQNPFGLEIRPRRIC